MPSKRSPRSSVASRDRPRTRSVAQRESTDQSATEEGGATSDVNNQGGSPSSDSPSSHRKKPRRVAQCEITEAPPSPPASPPPNEEEEERVVLFFSQYLCLSLWRAIERCEVWDSRLVKAFMQGPRTFAGSIQSVARKLQGRWNGPGEAERATDRCLEQLRPKGLYACCARILQSARKTTHRSRKRKDMNDEPQRCSTFEDPSTPRKFKHRFLMAEPRLTILSGPDKQMGDGDTKME